nr:portal protein [Aminobacter aminovorans]
MSDSETDDLLREAREAFQRASDVENDNRQTALEDIRFARAGEQWPADIVKQRQIDGRPCLTINKLPAFIRQVVNDARQNKPSIKVHPADSGADPETAEVINGLIRNIEYTSNADIAYDTATECAVTGGFGYIRVGLDYAFDDSFDMDIQIKRVSNPFSVYGDPNSTAADSSDWDTAFVVDRLSKSQFETQYKGKATVDWDSTAWTGLKGTDWLNDDGVLVAEWWQREEKDRIIVMTQDGMVFGKDELENDPDLQTLLQAGVLQIHGERTTKTHKVTQRIMSGADILETNDWMGRYIPIIPVYGDEFDIEGKRYFRSMIHNAIDSQRAFNYWRTAATELVALAPKVPYIGPQGAFDTDIDRWNTANTKSHPYLEYDGQVPPQRQPLDTGAAAGSLQEALNASDDMKAIIGIYDASLGARSNETSGRAIMARQREGDVSTFHFIDNKSRAIRHTGRILIDLIPKVYTGPRIVRIIGEDGSQAPKQINKEAPATDKKGNPLKDEQGNPVMAMHDLTSGKYDLTVSTGPSFTTRREEAAMQMTEMIRAFPQAATIVGPELAKNLDWPGADEIAEKMEAMTSGQIPPELQKAIEDGKQQIAKLTEENQSLKTDQSAEMAKIEAQKQLDMVKIQGQREIEMIKIASDKEIAREKIAADYEIAQMKMRLSAQNAAEATKAKQESRPQA